VLLSGICLAVAVVTGWATTGPHGTGSEQEPASGRLFSDPEYQALFARTAVQPEPEEVVLSADPVGPLIELEPYVVRGDTTLLLAAVRRYLDLGPVSISRRVAELSPTLARQAEFSGRAGETFFLQPAPGRPGDAPGVVPVSVEEFFRLARDVGDSVRSILPGGRRE
jgi:hypothetical protein